MKYNLLNLERSLQRAGTPEVGFVLNAFCILALCWVLGMQSKEADSGLAFMGEFARVHARGCPHLALPGSSSRALREA